MRNLIELPFTFMNEIGMELHLVEQIPSPAMAHRAGSRMSALCRSWRTFNERSPFMSTL
jgi:hypothetical protein